MNLTETKIKAKTSSFLLNPEQLNEAFIKWHQKEFRANFDSDKTCILDAQSCIKQKHQVYRAFVSGIRIGEDNGLKESKLKEAMKEYNQEFKLTIKLHSLAKITEWVLIRRRGEMEGIIVDCEFKENWDYWNKSTILTKIIHLCNKQTFAIQQDGMRQDYYIENVERI